MSRLTRSPLLAGLVLLAALITLLDVGCALPHASLRPTPDSCSLALRLERPGMMPMELMVSTGNAPFERSFFACPASGQSRLERAQTLWLEQVAERYGAICAGTSGTDADRMALCAGGATLCRLGEASCTVGSGTPSPSACTPDLGVAALPLCSAVPAMPQLRVFTTGDATETPVTSVSFGSVLVGQSASRSLTAKNTGTGELVVKPQRATEVGMPMASAAEFLVEMSGAGLCLPRDAAEMARGGRVLLAGETCTLPLRFQPGFGSLPMMPKRAELQVPFNDGMDRVLTPSLALSGEGISGQVTIAPADPTPAGLPAGLKLCFNVLPTMVGADRCWERPLRISANTAQVRLRQITPPAGYTVTPTIGPGALQPLLPAGGSQVVTVSFCAPPPAEPTQVSLMVSTNVVPQAAYPILLLPPSSMCTALPLP